MTAARARKLKRLSSSPDIGSPRLSVLLPVKNAAAHLQECLKSLKFQTFFDYEIVALEHGSADASPEILAAWAQQEPRLRILPSLAPSLPAALNEGLAACRGSLIARMDADDISLPARFERQLALFDADAQLALAGTEVEFFGDFEISEGYKNYETWVNALRSPEAILREIFIECPLPHPSWMARREALLSLGYLDDGLPEDYQLILRAAEKGLKMAKPEGVLLRWREHPGRHSRDHGRYRRPAFMRLRARFLKRMLIKEGPCVVWGAGDRGRLLTRLLLEEGARIESVVGWNPGGEAPVSVHGIPVISPDELPLRLPGPLIACVGEPGVRDQIRDWAGKRNWAEGKDFWFAS